MPTKKMWKPDVIPDQEAEALVREIRRLSDWFVEEEKKTLAHVEVNENEYRVLAAVIEGKAANVTQLAKALGQSNGQASKMVKSLGNGGWLIMTPAEKDRRKVQVAATEAGQRIFAECKRRVRSLVQWPRWREQREWARKILPGLQELNERIEASGMTLGLEDPNHDKQGWPLEREGDDWPRRRPPLGQLRVSGAAQVKVEGHSSAPKKEL